MSMQLEQFKRWKSHRDWRGSLLPHLPSGVGSWLSRTIITSQKAPVGKDILERLSRPACRFLGSRTAVIGGAMSHVSRAPLVAAISEAGGFGVLAAGGRRPDALEAEIRATRNFTDHPFGVNMVTLDPRVDQQIEVCLDHRVSHVILGGGVPNAAQIKRAKQNGARVICFAPSLPVAERLLRHGADAFIVEGHEAGGHVGPVATATLAQEMLPLMRKGVIVFVAGGIGTGEAIASYLALGASGCQLGTRFVCALESHSHAMAKGAYIKAASREAVVSPQLDPQLKSIPVRALINQATSDFVTCQRELLVLLSAKSISLPEANLEIEAFWSGRLRRAIVDGDIMQGSLMAGQSVGSVTAHESVADIICSLTEQAAVRLGSIVG
jgi:enoyl-[acyl-carrier protein] reductase II